MPHADYLNIALIEAQKAARAGEVPIGAVIVRDGRVIARAHNMRERKQNAAYHAEMLAIMRACKKLRSWRLDDCDMYVTLEPCQMCMGACINARMRHVYFGAKSTSDLNWTTPTTNLGDAKSSQILLDFFKKNRYN